MDKEKLYKVLTLVFSGLSVIILFFSAIYFEYYRKKENQISNINQRLEDFYKKREQLKKIPTLELQDYSFKDSKLPDIAFSKLELIPTLITISYISGTSSAIDNHLTIKTNEKILTYITSQSSDTIIVKKYGKQLFVDVPKLRKGNTIEIIVYTKNLTDVETKIISENAIFISDLENEELPDLYSTNWDELHPYDFNNIKNVHKIIDKIKSQLSYTKKKPIVDIDRLILFLIMAFYMILVIIYFYKKIRNRKLAEKIQNAYDQDSIKKDMHVSDVEKIFGKPKYIYIPSKGEHANKERWCYEPTPYFFMGALPDIFIIVDDKKVIDYCYHFYK